jgi:hypothetical protein
MLSVSFLAPRSLGGITRGVFLISCLLLPSIAESKSPHAASLVASCHCILTLGQMVFCSNVAHMPLRDRWLFGGPRRNPSTAAAVIWGATAAATATSPLLWKEKREGIRVLGGAAEGTLLLLQAPCPILTSKSIRIPSDPSSYLSSR